MKKLYYTFLNKILEKSPPCNVIVSKISERFDRELSLQEKVKMNVHMKLCHCCTRYKKQMDNLHEAIITKMQMVQNENNFIEKLPLDASIRMKSLIMQQIKE